jgi:hypothetical protein
VFGGCVYHVRLDADVVIAGAGAGNFSAIGNADFEESKKSHQGEIRDK